jgi:HEAT repeats
VRDWTLDDHADEYAGRIRALLEASAARGEALDVSDLCLYTGGQTTYNRRRAFKDLLRWSRLPSPAVSTGARDHLVYFANELLDGQQPVIAGFLAKIEDEIEKTALEAERTGDVGLLACLPEALVKLIERGRRDAPLRRLLRLASDPDPRVRASALEALGPLLETHPAVRAPIIEALRSHDCEVARGAVNALEDARLDNTWALPTLVDFILKAPDQHFTAFRCGDTLRRAGILVEQQTARAFGFTRPSDGKSIRRRLMDELKRHRDLERQKDLEILGVATPEADSRQDGGAAQAASARDHDETQTDLLKARAKLARACSPTSSRWTGPQRWLWRSSRLSWHLLIGLFVLVMHLAIGTGAFVLGVLPAWLFLVLSAPLIVAGCENRNEMTGGCLNSRPAGGVGNEEGSVMAEAPRDGDTNDNALRGDGVNGDDDRDPCGESHLHEGRLTDARCVKGCRRHHRGGSTPARRRVNQLPRVNQPP